MRNEEPMDEDNPTKVEEPSGDETSMEVDLDEKRPQSNPPFRNKL
jgi:hypothetical protein